MRAQKLYNHMQLYVKGQDLALKQIATLVSLHLNCWKYNKTHDVALQGKENAFIMGSTGTGKTETLRALGECAKIKCPIIMLNSLQYTANGWRGSKNLNELGEEIFRQAFLKSNVTELTRDTIDEIVDLAESAIICLDEFDKRHIDRKTSPDYQVFETAYQGDLLKIIEGTTLEVQIKEFPRVYIRTDNMLFLLMGAFNGFNKQESARPVGFSNKIGTDEKGHTQEHHMGPNISDQAFINYGFMEELVGRVPWRICYEDLTDHVLVDILKKSKHSVIREYKQLFESMGNELCVTDEGYTAIAKEAIHHKTGARALFTVVKDVLASSLFDLLNDTGLIATIDEDAVASRTVEIKSKT
ncbi:AAA family ATPase [uncultured Veillonella sp.]|uniref:AAA family ATPase n=1 Tax=uncultured Veillonella sp. TaxID=159268 RepID=UPI0026188934|nr:AAA family ATPase [uncultured Veillonella sp.]